MLEKPLNTYPLFVGLTRPPMYLGVTQTFFLFNALPCFIFFILSMKIIIAGLCFALLHLVGMVLCWDEPNFFNILVGKFSLSNHNQSFWGCNSYDPS